MKVSGGIGLCLIVLIGCGDSGVGDSRSAQACSQICSIPDQCFEELGIPTQGVNCMEECEAQIDAVGVDCINALVDTINCLPSCDVDTLTDEQLLACQDEALAIGPACDD